MHALSVLPRAVSVALPRHVVLLAELLVHPFPSSWNGPYFFFGTFRDLTGPMNAPQEHISLFSGMVSLHLRREGVGAGHGLHPRSPSIFFPSLLVIHITCSPMKGYPNPYGGALNSVKPYSSSVSLNG